jgi:hypothetical protein
MVVVAGATGVAAVAGDCGAVVTAGSAAKTGAAIVKASRLIGRCENFNMERSQWDETISSRPQRASFEALPPTQKHHNYGFMAAITYAME